MGEIHGMRTFRTTSRASLGGRLRCIRVHSLFISEKFLNRKLTLTNAGESSSYVSPEGPAVIGGSDTDEGGPSVDDGSARTQTLLLRHPVRQKVYFHEHIM